MAHTTEILSVDSMQFQTHRSDTLEVHHLLLKQKVL